MVTFASMKAVRIHKFGGPEVLTYEDVEPPDPGPNEVLLRVRAAGVNPADWKVRSGTLGQAKLPLILGFDVSGTVERTGAAAKEFNLGDELFGRVPIGRDGAYAEFVAVPATELVKKPSSIDHIHAAAIPVAGLTAWQALDAMQLSSGQTVLVHGAAGAVGSFATQLARFRGLNVIATAPGEDAAFVRELGAALVIDYKSQRFEDVVHDVDAVLDVVGGDTYLRSWRVLKPNGVIVSTVGSREVPPGAKGRAVAIVSKSDRTQLAQLANLVAERVIKVRIGQVLPLSEARKAHELGESGKVRGKIVLEVAGR
ncbi:MAG: Bifunctional protein: zinc-containing alcohol dehydrogenase [Myxococcales bacterium]|nr:Bifunctional protein: zinc-containing alcohol dehydrogenase [Myxococcales bacterium]